ncbi:ATP-binding protein [Uliginosibacterium sp. H1]|uniref:ATP-binding protein n=1 Tax=Uliginosibacterium sp. H1 TaxID=3114757 RepID=UPI002E17D812|nr:ATP-binding protein [Uliginosibacterium sp. H1]
MRAWRHERTLSSWLIFLLVATSLVTLSIVGSAILAVRVAQIARDTRESLGREASEMAERVEVLLGGIEARVEVFGELAPDLPATRLTTRMDELVDTGQIIDALYLVDESGITRAASEGPLRHRRSEELVGADLSSNPLFRDARSRGLAVWSDKYLSVISGKVAIGVGVPMADGSVLIAEIDQDYLLLTMRLARGGSGTPMWLLDSRGEMLADTGGEHVSGSASLGDMAAVREALQGAVAGKAFAYRGRDYYLEFAQSGQLGWYVAVKAPAGLDNPQIRSAVVELLAMFAGVIVIGALLAPLWSRGLTQALGSLTARARQLGDGRVQGEWPRGRVQEFNELAADLERMAAVLSERERKFLAIFNASPVAMLVLDGNADPAVLELNDAWARQFGFERSEVVGRSFAEITLIDGQSARGLLAEALAEGAQQGEVMVSARTGRVLLCALSARAMQLDGRAVLIVVMEDVTERRGMEHALLELNTQLESRVAQRTDALAQANDSLSQALTDLRMAQDDLVRTEKLASLGELVAGVAHELNTPLGNGLMAVTTLSDQLRQFRLEVAAGLKRSALDTFVANVDMAATIAARNLNRAAELVTSFKQVAVDQASSQRRGFDLRDMVDEVLMTMLPMLKRTPYVVHNEVPAGLRMDSYPGPLGQVLTNLVNNAVLHGFDGRDRGEIWIIASADGAPGTGSITLTLRDDGSGIAPDMLGRIFDPFVTSRKGRGGTGLGLHIVHNTVTQLLGGSVTVDSWAGAGTAFYLNLPVKAPEPQG